MHHALCHHCRDAYLRRTKQGLRPRNQEARLRVQIQLEEKELQKTVRCFSGPAFGLSALNVGWLLIIQMHYCSR